MEILANLGFVMDNFSAAVAASLPDGVARASAATTAHEVGLPSIETEEWRYSLVADLPLAELRPATEPPSIDPSTVDRYEVIAERSATVVVVDGWVLDISVTPGWAEKGLEVTATPNPVEPLADAESTAFDHLHRAFAPQVVTVRVPPGLTVPDPVVVVNHHATAGGASFPHLVVEAGDDADLTVVERQSSVVGTGLTVGVVELEARPSARLRYQVVQDLDRAQWQLSRLRTTAGAQATITAGVAAFGARYARLRADGHLVGPGATANLSAAYYGDGDQVHDFRVFQHHEDRNTRSDLLFKGAQDDSSGSIYTGMIHIHPNAPRTNAFQTNRNVKLGPDAWAWSVPNLEIENNDVHCSHASTVSPVDEDQQFYLQSRGVPPVTADRLIVAGFFDEVIGRLPVAATHDDIRARVAHKLDGRTAA